MLNLKPIKLLPAREQVASALRKAILSKELVEGDELTLDDMGSRLGVSSTPVREAFQILARDGLIQLRPNKGALVLGVTEKVIRDHYQTRAVLEREAAVTVCRTVEDLVPIVDSHEGARQALAQGNSRDYSNFNQAFHFAIWTAADNRKMRQLLSEMWNGLSMGHKVSEEEYAKISIREHEGIVSALTARDEKQVGERMERHIIRSMENILTHFLP